MRKQVVVLNYSGCLPVFILEALEHGGFGLLIADSFSAAFKEILRARPVLFILDVFSWTEREEEFLWELVSLQSANSMRRLVLISNSGSMDSVCALEAGADAFLVKPMSERELLARITALLRSLPREASSENTQILGDLCLLRDGMELSIDGNVKKLSPIEFSLLAFLMDHAGHVVSRETLLENLWPQSGESGYARVVDVAVLRVREKLEENPSNPKRLLTRRGQGYILVDPME